MAGLLLSLLIPQAFAQTPTSQGENEKQRVFIDCSFRYTPGVTCNEFKDAFFSDFKNFVIREPSPKESDLELAIVDEIIATNLIGYHFTWTSHIETMKGSNFSYPLSLPSTLDRLSRLNQLSANASKGFSIFLKITSTQIKNDTLILTYAAPSSDPGSAPPDWMQRLEKSPWFISLRGGGQSSENGNDAVFTRNSSGSSSLEVFHIRDRTKVNLNASFNYQRQSLSMGNAGTFTAENFKTYLSGIVVYTLTPPGTGITGDKNPGSWSVAVFNSNTTDVGANIQNLNSTMAGVEWTLVPFRTTENQEIAFRVGPEYNSLQLYRPNDLGNVSEDFWRVIAKIYYYWVIFEDRVNLTLGASGEGNLTYWNRSTWSLNGQATFQVSRALSVSGGIRRVFSEQPMLWYPGPDSNSGPTNPLQGAFQTGQPGGQMMMNVGITVSLGNTIRKQRDRRWAN
ncbi:MAG: hypothetical protein KGP28_10715 [Bdellovibrionales bacterium]|nr:hypothetical protein [Bdellovibrionales bacterium]